MTTAVVTCPECRSPLRLPQATPEGRVRCPKCKAVFAPVLDAEVDASESVAVVLDEPADTDKSFFERVAAADDPFAPLPSKPFEEVADAEAEVLPIPGPANPKRSRREEPEREPVRSRNGVAFALVAMIGIVFLGGVAGAGYVAYRVLIKDRTPEPVADAKPEKPVDASIPPDAMAKVKAATVFVRTQYPDGQATTSAGFFVRGPGLILTNARSVGQGQKKMPASKVTATVGSRTIAARILAADSQLDLALLQVPGLDLPEPLALDADTFTVREPMPLAVFSAADGRIVTSNVNVSGSKSVSGTRPWFLLSGQLPQGAWGGPVTDGSGKVVGVSAVVGNGDPVAVPAESAWSFIQNGARSAEESGGIAFAAPGSGKTGRDEFDDTFPPNMPNPWRQGRIPRDFPPNWGQPVPFPPPVMPAFPDFPRPRQRD